jgi:hypothetical protein
MPVDEWLDEALLGSQVSTLPVEAVPENPFVQKILQSSHNPPQQRMLNTRNLTPAPPGQAVLEENQRKSHQQSISLNNIKGLHAHQQSSLSSTMIVKPSETEVEQQQKSRTDDRKASFSPSIFVRKYLPFFK